MKEVRYGGGSHICNKCGDRVFGSKIHRCPFPKEELEKWYKLYLTESEKFHDFKDWLESTDMYNYAGLAEKCKFSTTAELRKQLNILENKYSVSKKITESTKNSGFSVYIPENAKSNLYTFNYWLEKYFERHLPENKEEWFNVAELAFEEYISRVVSQKVENGDYIVNPEYKDLFK